MYTYLLCRVSQALEEHLASFLQQSVFVQLLFRCVVEPDQLSASFRHPYTASEVEIMSTFTLKVD